MVNFFQKIVNYFFNLKNKNTKGVLSASFGSKKVCITKSESLEITSTQEAQKAQFQKELNEIFEKYLNNTDGIFDFIKENGAEIYRIADNDMLLEFISQAEGYISPKKGFKALILNIFLKKKVAFSTNPMFVFRKGDISIITLYYEIYKWYFELKNFLDIQIEPEKISNSDISSLSFKDTIELKTKVEHDIEAINFVLNFVKSHQGSKDASEKIKNEGSINI